MGAFDDLIPNSQSSTAGAFDDLIPKDETPKATDYLKGIASGVGGLASGVGYLAEAAGADKIGAAIRGVGDTTQKYWQDAMTPAGKRAAESQVFEDDPNSALPKLGDRWGQALGMGVAQSAPSMLAAAIPGGIAATGLRGIAGLAASRGIGGALAPLAAGTAAPIGGWGANLAGQVAARAPTALGFGAAEGATAGAMNAAQWKSDIEQRPEESLAALPGYASLAAQIGPAAARKQISEEGAADIMRNTTLSTGFIGALTGGGALGSAFQRATTGAKGGLLGAISRDAGKEAFQEAPQSAGERLIQNVATRDYLDPNQSASQGVLSDALSGAAIGGAMGGITGGGSYAISGPLSKAVAASPGAAVPPVLPVDDGQQTPAPAADIVTGKGTIPQPIPQFTTPPQPATGGAPLEQAPTAMPVPQATQNAPAAPGSPSPATTAELPSPANAAESAGAPQQRVADLANRFEQAAQGLDELSQFSQQEVADVRGRRSGIVSGQKTMREAKLEAADARVETARQKETEAKRNAILDGIDLQGETNIVRRFEKALAQNGIAQNKATPEDRARLARRVSAAKGLSEDYPPIPSATNELVLPEKRATSAAASGRRDQAIANLAKQKGVRLKGNALIDANGRKRATLTPKEIEAVSGIVQIARGKDANQTEVAIPPTQGPEAAALPATAKPAKGIAGALQYPQQVTEGGAPLAQTPTAMPIGKYGKAKAAEPAAPQQPLSGAGEQQPVASLQSAYNEAKAKLEAIGPEPRKPSPERQAFGTKGKAGAPADEVAKYEASVKAYVSWKAKYNRLKKAEVEAGNALFAAKKAEPAEQSQYDKEGYDSKGYDKEGFNRKGFDKYGYDEYGFDKDGVDEGGIGRDDDFYMSDAQIAKANSALGFRRDAGAGGWPVENDYLEKIDTANAYAVADKQGFVYRGLNMPDTQAYISRGSDLVLVSGNNFDDQTAGISFTPFLDIAKDYATRTQTAAVRHPDGAIVKIDMAALRRIQLEEEGDGELAFYDRKELTIPAGKWEVTYNPDAEGPFTLAAKIKPKPRQQPQPSPIMRRDDLVGAIMRVTGGDGIASSMALTIAGDTAGRGLAKLRGLFTNRGTIDLGEVATRLREDEGFDVRDGEHLSDLIRAASFGDTAVSMERAERDKDSAEEKRHRDYIRQNAKKLKIKTVAVKFTDLEQRVIAALTRRHERAVELLDERAKKRFDAALEESYAILPEDVVDAVLVDVNGRKLSPREFWSQATETLRYMVADAKAKQEQEALNAIEGAEPDWLKDDGGRGNQPAGGGEAANRVVEEAGGEAGFNLAAQTPEEIAAAEAASKEAKQAEAAAAAAAARKEKAAQDKAEKDRRAAEVLKEREAAKKAEVDKAAEEFALGQAAPEPVVKKVTTEDARGQEDLRFSQEGPQDKQPSKNVRIGYRSGGNTKGQNPTFGNTEGNGIYVAYEKETAAFFAAGRKIETIKYHAPRKPLVVDDEPLPLLNEEFPIYSPIKKTDSEWIKLNKLAAQQAKLLYGVSDDNWNGTIVGNELTKLMIGRGYDAVDVTSDGEKWIVLLDDSLLIEEKKPADYTEKILKKGTVLYYGTTGSFVIRDEPGTLFLTGSEKDSIELNEQSKENQSVAKVILRQDAKVKNINREVMASLEDGSDIDFIIIDYAEEARKDGYDFVSFSYPSADGGKMNVWVAANTKNIEIENQSGLLEKPIFSFAGQQSATADQFQLERAKQLLADGANANAVRQQTGWFKGVDGKWRYEIDDSGASLKAHGFGFGELLDALGKNLKLAEVLDHPALFAAYPSIAGSSVEVIDEKSQNNGELVTNKDGGFTIRVNAGLGEARALSVMLHEIQHGIQNVEGFASGGSMDQFVAPILRKKAELERRVFEINKLLSRSKGNEYLELLADRSEIVAEIQRLPDDIGALEQGYKQYRKLAGEVESRNVQQRQNFTADKRRLSDPLGTQDVAPEDVIVMFNGKEAKDAPAPFNTTRASAMAADGASPADAAVFDMAAKGKSAQEILSFLSKASRRPFNRILASALMRIGVSSTVSVDPAAGWRNNQNRQGAKFAASYSPKTDTVALYTPREAERHALHEFVHSATLKAIARGGPAARQMQAVFDHVQKSGTMSDQYGMGNFARFKNETDAQFKKRMLDEFTAELFTNPLFQVRLKQLPAPSGSKLKSAWDWIVRVIANMLGLRTKAQETALDRALSVGAALLQENAALSMPPVAGTRYHTTWHGSPHKFYTFDLSKILTGEGANAFGRGIYVAEAPEVARSYQAMGYNRAVVLPDGKGYAIFNSLTDEKVSETFATRDIAFAEKEKYAGNNYKVDLPAEAVERMLDWDKPLSKQAPEVKSAFKKYGMGGTRAWNEITGMNLYIQIGKRNDPENISRAASELLLKAGIPGIRYLDEKSRAAGKGTSNFVLFDDKLARIIEVNGVETGVQPWQPGEWDATQGGERFSQEQPFSGREVATTPLKPGTKTLMVDGVERPALNSNGKPIHWSEEGVRNFWRWFGASKVVDEQGRPLVVYHGTRAEFSVFDYSRIGDQGRGEGAGFYFTNNKSVASGYGTPMETYLSIKKPMEYDAKSFSKDVVGKIVKRVAEIEAQSEGIDVGDGFLSNFGDVGYDGLVPVIKKAAGLIAADVTSLDQLGGIVGSGVNPSHVNLAVREVVGYDGVFARGFSNAGSDDNKIFVAFFPEQIKSATGNTGAFSPEDPDIRHSLAANWQQSPVAPGNLYQAAKKKAASLLTPERLDKVIYEMQDKFVDLRRIRDHIKEIGGTITDLNDAYLGEELYHKRLAYRTEQFLKEELQPFFADMKARGVTMPELEKFLHARHAPEANAEMARSNPNQKQIDAGRQKYAAAVRGLDLNLQTAKARGMATVAIEKALTNARAELVRWNSAQAFKGTEADRLSLSGMSNSDASALMASLTPAQRADMNALAAKVDAINEGTLQTLERYGLMDKAALNTWRNTYKYYVPLHRDEANPDSVSHPIGQGFNVRGDASKRRTGSNQEVTNIFSHIAMQREAALTRGEKNRVMQKLYLMARQNPIADIWSVGKVPMIDTIDRATGFVRSVPDPQYKDKPNVITLRIGGKDVAIVMNEYNPQALRLAQSVKNLDVDDLHYLIPVVGKATRWFASINTQYNPIFGLINFARDVQTASLNLSTTAIAGKQKEVFKDTMRILGEIIKNKGRMPTAGNWAPIYKEFNEVGGTTGYRDLFLTAEDRSKAVTDEIKALDRGKVSQAAHGIAGWLSDYNEAMENATRLAAYRAAIDSGMTKERAASLAKNLTVNFNRKGRQTRELGALYAFFNAAVQGTARMAQTLSGPAGKKIMLGGVLAGAASAMAGIAAMGGGDGEDDEWSKIPEFVKERSFIIPAGKDKYIAIPMPLGFHFLPNIGRLMVEMAVYKDKTLGKQMASLFTVLADAFNPLGGSAPPMQIIAPTVMDPFIALAQNKDWTGKPIYVENFNSLNPQPGSARAKDSATPIAKGLADAINAVTGGTKYVPGGFSPTPDQIDYVIGQLTGGVGREVGKLSSTIAAPFTGEELPAHKIPLLGRLYGSTAGATGQAGKFYENIKRANEVENELKGRRKDGIGVDDYLRENPSAVELAARGNAAERQIRALRQMRSRIVEAGGDDAASKARQINDRMAKVMRGFNMQVERMQ